MSTPAQVAAALRGKLHQREPVEGDALRVTADLIERLDRDRQALLDFVKEVPRRTHGMNAILAREAEALLRRVGQ